MATIHDRGVRAWIDTDIGTNPDDGAALLLALAHPAIEVVGISTVSGDTAVRAAVARAYVGDAELPIVAGIGRPRDGGTEPRWLGHEGFGLVAAPGRGTSETTSEHELGDQVNAARADVLIALGPLTNVAWMLERGAAPERIVAMAGVNAPVWHRGELVDTDHNTASDPGAAAIVDERAHALLEVPLDVTVLMRLSDRDAAVLASKHPRLAHEVAEWLAHTGTVTLHDPLAVLAAVPEEHDGIGLQTTTTSTGRTTATAVDGARAIRRVMALLASATASSRANATEPR